jgi:hypothetical protein
MEKEKESQKTDENKKKHRRKEEPGMSDNFSEIPPIDSTADA